MSRGAKTALCAPPARLAFPPLPPSAHRRRSSLSCSRLYPSFRPSRPSRNPLSPRRYVFRLLSFPEIRRALCKESPKAASLSLAQPAPRLCTTAMQQAPPLPPKAISSAQCSSPIPFPSDDDAPSHFWVAAFRHSRNHPLSVLLRALPAPSDYSAPFPFVLAPSTAANAA